MESLYLSPDAAFQEEWIGWHSFLGSCREKPKTLEEWRLIAMSLASNNNGRVPSNSWLVSNGYAALNHVMRRNPEAFDGMDQDKLRKTIDDHVRDAERIAARNGGRLRSHAWLRTNGYASLSQFINVRRDRFGHLPQDKLINTIDDNVAKAESMAKKHGGVLPSKSWLSKHGHHDLVNGIHHHPERFKHILKTQLRFTLEETILKAELIASENSGVLPCSVWLKANGHHGILNAKIKHKERFAHIKQEFLKEWTKRTPVPTQGATA